MTNNNIALSVATLLTLTAVAHADSDYTFDAPMAPASGVELVVGGGYTQAAGKSGIGGDMRDIAGPGGGGEVQLGYRLTPHLGLGGYATLEGYSAGNSLNEKMNDVVGGSAGLKADWHFRPSRAVDPWVSVGGGMRWLWVDRRNTETVSLRGVDLARLQVGVDYRINKNFAISPTLGATATTYLDVNSPATDGFVSIDNKHVSWTFGAGLLGRFNL